VGVVVLGLVVVVAVGGVLVVRGPSGVTAASAEGRTSTVGATGSPKSAERDASWDDAEALDAYAAELGLVMARSHGPEPAAYARRVDGPGPGVETLALRAADGRAEVVLRLRQHRADCGWLGASCQEYEVSACYRWAFQSSIDDHEPARLDECPEGPVIDLGPAPADPRLPDRLLDVLTKRLAPARGLSEPAVLAQVRAAYMASRRAALAAPGGREPGRLLLLRTALDAGSSAVVGDTVAVAVGRGTECVMVRVSPRGADVWVPERVTLLPGETGCHPEGQLAMLEN
jgi:hypothetical protein